MITLLRKLAGDLVPRTFGRHIEAENHASATGGCNSARKGAATSRHGNGCKSSSRRVRRAHTSYEKWTKDELYDRARTLDIVGRSTMVKAELITALRSR